MYFVTKLYACAELAATKQPSWQQTIIERENSSGEVRVKGKLIKWCKTNGDIVSIDLEQVAIIGKYTTDSGPFADDWFLVGLKNPPPFGGGYVLLALPFKSIFGFKRSVGFVRKRRFAS